MDSYAVRPVDPDELPDIVEQAVAIVDGANLDDADRALLLPLVYGTLTARAIFPTAPAVSPPQLLGRLDAFKGGR